MLASVPKPQSAATVSRSVCDVSRSARAAQIVLQAHQSAHVRYNVYNVLGQLVYSEAEKPISPGWSIFRWKGQDKQEAPVPNGTYLLRFEIFDKKNKHEITSLQQKVMLYR